VVDLMPHAFFVIPVRDLNFVVGDLNRLLASHRILSIDTAVWRALKKMWFTFKKERGLF
jgi:hypothetical protein